MFTRFFKNTARTLQKSLTTATSGLHSEFPKSLSPEECDLILNTVQSFSLKNNLANVSLKHLDSGHSPYAKNFSINVSGQKHCVLRYIHGGRGYSKKRAALEMEIQQAAVHSGITPEILYQDNNHGIIIRKYVLQENDWLKNLDKKSLDGFALFFRKLHAINTSKIIDCLKESPILPYLDFFLKDVKEKWPQISNCKQLCDYQASLDDIANKMALVKKQIFQYKGSFGFCHGDMHFRNILPTAEKISVIDFEMASFFDPLHDLASFCVCTNLTDEAANNLLTKYLQRQPTVEESTRWQLNLCLEYYWYALGALYSIAKENLAQCVIDRSIQSWSDYQGSHSPAELSPSMLLTISHLLAKKGNELYREKPVLEEKTEEVQFKHLNLNQRIYCP
jgi:thiamine kinase-like enzyme